MFNSEEIIREYRSGKSVREIADLYKTYPNKIARLLKTSGETLRTKEEAAKLAVDKGKIKPPMLGKKRSQIEKDNISKKRSNRWKEMSEKDLGEFKKNAKDRWESQTDEERVDRQYKARQAIRLASTEGSKAEKFLYERLTRAGYDVIIHKKGLISGERYEVDLYIPSLLVAIEIDGPQHFLPIYGEQSLNKNIKYDSVKNGALISRGMCIIRVKYLMKHNSQQVNTKLFELVVEQLKKIEQKFPDLNNRMIELEISHV
jgi:hypothetical protein